MKIKIKNKCSFYFGWVFPARSTGNGFVTEGAKHGMFFFNDEVEIC